MGYRWCSRKRVGLDSGGIRTSEPSSRALLSSAKNETLSLDARLLFSFSELPQNRVFSPLADSVSSAPIASSHFTQTGTLPTVIIVFSPQ
jgi:hypothetical protein